MHAYACAYVYAYVGTHYVHMCVFAYTYIHEEMLLAKERLVSVQSP